MLKNWNSFFNIKSILAFTLAEVLIVIGIIGIVAEMTIPTLQKEFQKQITITNLKKQYSSLSQAVKLSESDNGPNENWNWGLSTDDTVRQSFDTFWAPYLRISKYCSSYSDCGYASVSPWLKPGGTDYGMTLVYAPMRTTVMLNDGSLLLVKAFQSAPVMGDPDVPSRYIFVDINGPQKPNTLGKDVFEFALDPQRGLMPFGYAASDVVVNSNCSKTGYGEACAAKIMRNGWSMSSDYPW